MWIFGEKNDGAVAFWSSGAAGDVNPIMMTNNYMPDPETGKPTFLNSGGYTIAKVLAVRHYADILRVIEKIERMKDRAELACAVDWSHAPGRDVLPHGAPKLCDDSKSEMTDNDKTYDIRVHLMRIGDIALMGISGELYTTLAWHMKEVSPFKNTIIVTHDASLMTNAGYIHDDDAFKRGCFATDRTRNIPGYVRDSLAKVTMDLFDEVL